MFFDHSLLLFLSVPLNLFPRNPLTSTPFWCLIVFSLSCLQKCVWVSDQGQFTSVHATEEYDSPLPAVIDCPRHQEEE